MSINTKNLKKLLWFLGSIAALVVVIVWLIPHDLTKEFFGPIWNIGSYIGSEAWRHMANNTWAFAVYIPLYLVSYFVAVSLAPRFLQSTWPGMALVAVVHLIWTWFIYWAVFNKVAITVGWQ